MGNNVITEYILSQPAKYQEHLWHVYNTLEETLGEITEKTFVYGMPTYKAKRNVIHFSCTKTHVGIYPGPDAIEQYKSQFGSYGYSKGTLRVKYSQQIPTGLIQEMALYSYNLNK